IQRCDATVVFANELFAITLVPLLLFVALLFRKSFYLKPIGGGLDLYIGAQRTVFREYLLKVLRATNGILVQTRLLKDELTRLGCSNAYYLPGCRPSNPLSRVKKREPAADLRLIFLGHIARLKGPLILLDALTYVQQLCDKQVTCDFYGPIYDEVREEFLRRLNTTPNAHYSGVASPGAGSQLISAYDALVLPTYYETEGHPGVIIEAMHAGVPVISTQFRTFRELIVDRINGLLVPTK